MIRFVNPTDTAAIAEIYRPMVEETVISFEMIPPNAAEFQRRIEKTIPAYPWIVAEVEGKVAGYAYAGLHRARAAYRWTAELSVYIHSDFHRRGIAKALYGAVMDILRIQGYVNVLGGITLPNPASEKLHATMGFTRVGAFNHIGYKFGGFQATEWWEKLLVSAETTPSEPVSLTEIDPSVIDEIFAKYAKDIR